MAEFRDESVMNRHTFYMFAREAGVVQVSPLPFFPALPIRCAECSRMVPNPNVGGGITEDTAEIEAVGMYVRR